MNSFELGNLHESKRILLRTIKGHRPEIVDYVKKINLPNHFHQFALHRLFNKPLCAIVFSTWAAFTELFDGLVLPSKCPMIVAEDFSSVLFSPSFTMKNIEITWEIDRAFGVSGCFLADDYTDYRIRLYDWPLCHVNQLIDTNYPLKAVLFLTKIRSKGVFDIFTMSKKVDSSLVVAGGSFRSLSYYKSGKCKTRQVAHILAITFSGEKLKVASIVLELSSREDVIRKLIEFKKNLHFDADQFDAFQHTIGFVFYTYCKTNKESLANILDQCFPRVLFSGSSVGEIISINSSLVFSKGNYLHERPKGENSEFVILLIHLTKNEY